MSALCSAVAYAEAYQKHVIHTGMGSVVSNGSNQQRKYVFGSKQILRFSIQFAAALVLFGEGQDRQFAQHKEQALQHIYRMRKVMVWIFVMINTC